MGKLSFVIIIPAYNAGKWIGKSIAILKAQIYSHYRVVVIDDFSTDDTWRQIEKAVACDNRFCTHRNDLRRLKIHNVVAGIKQMSPGDEDVVAVIDGDDRLFNEKSLYYVIKAYDEYDCWMTYGKMVSWPSGKVDMKSKQVNENSDLRKGLWIFSQLRTYKYFLWKNIQNKDLRDYATGDYYRAACDTAIFRPMLEMAGYKKVKSLKEIVYVWNRNNPLSVAKINKSLQDMNAVEVINRTRYEKGSKKSLVERIVV